MENFIKIVQIANESVLYDRGDETPLCRGRLYIWAGHARLFEGGPTGPVCQVVDLLDEDDCLLFRHEKRVPSHLDQLQSILRESAPVFASAAWHVRIAGFDPELEITGLSAPSGGWLRGRAMINFEPTRQR